MISTGLLLCVLGGGGGGGRGLAFVIYHSFCFFLVYKHMNLYKKKKLRQKISRSPFNYHNSSKYMEQKEGKKIATFIISTIPNPAFCNMASVLLEMTIIIKWNNQLFLTVLGAWLQITTGINLIEHVFTWYITNKIENTHYPQWCQIFNSCAAPLLAGPAWFHSLIVYLITIKENIVPM